MHITDFQLQMKQVLAITRVVCGVGGLRGAQRNLAARLLEPGRLLVSREAAALLLPALRGCSCNGCRRNR